MFKLQKMFPLMILCGVLTGCGSKSLEDTIFADYIPDEETRIFYGNKGEKPSDEFGTATKAQEDDESQDVSEDAIEATDENIEQTAVNMGIDDPIEISSSDQMKMYHDIMTSNSYKSIMNESEGVTLSLDISESEGMTVHHTMYMKDSSYYYLNNENEILVLDNGEAIGQETEYGITYPYEYLLADGAYNILLDTQKVNIFPVFEDGKLNKVVGDGKSCAVWVTFTKSQLRQKGCIFADYMDVTDTLDVVYKVDAASHELKEITAYKEGASGQYEFAHGTYSYDSNKPEIPESFRSLFDKPDSYVISLYQNKGSVREKCYKKAFPETVYAKIGLPAGYYTCYSDQGCSYPLRSDFLFGQQTVYIN